MKSKNQDPMLYGSINIILFSIIIILSFPVSSMAQEITKSKQCLDFDLVSYPKMITKTTLSQLAKSFRFVQLETNETNPIVAIHGLHHVKDKIIVKNDDKSILVFSSTGEFLNTIGRIGQGPTEYLSDFRMWPSMLDESIWVMSGNKKALNFDFSGKHLKKIDLSSIGKQPIFSAIGLSNDLLVINGEVLHKNKQRSVFWFISTLDHTVKKLLINEQDGGSSYPFFDLPTGLGMARMYDNTFYRVFNSSLQPMFTANFGKRDIKTTEDLFESEDEHAAVYFVAETHKYIYLYVTLENQENDDILVFFNKEDGSIEVCQTEGFNDVLKVDFMPYLRSNRSEFVTFVNPFEIHDSYTDLVSKIGKRRTTSEYPLLDSLYKVSDQSDNPILVYFEIDEFSNK